MGKDNIHWGPGRHGSLLLSENPLPMSMVKLTAQYYPVKFQAVTGALGSDIARKYLSGHRVELNLSSPTPEAGFRFEKLRLGVAEVIVYSERFETIYLNPVQIYTVTEIPAKVVSGESKESPDNTLISGDFELALMRNLGLYGEILIDDFRPFGYGLNAVVQPLSPQRAGWGRGIRPSPAAQNLRTPRWYTITKSKPDWPMVEVKANERRFVRPEILGKAV